MSIPSSRISYQALSPHPANYQRLSQADEFTPVKFLTGNNQQYVRKPPRKFKPIKSIEDPEQSIDNQCCNCDCQCCSSLIKIIQTCQLMACCSKNNDSDNQDKKDNNGNGFKCGIFCCECVESQKDICLTCFNNLCSECQKTLGHDKQLCRKCQTKLCPDCRISYRLLPLIQLRNYPIRLKGANKYHFINCTCQRCHRKQSLSAQQSNIKGQSNNKQQIMKQSNEDME